MDLKTVEIKSEPRGSHWIAWPVPASVVPYPILCVGLTQEEAETRLRTWLDGRMA